MANRKKRSMWDRIRGIPAEGPQVRPPVGIPDKPKVYQQVSANNQMLHQYVGSHMAMSGWMQPYVPHIMTDRTVRPPDDDSGSELDLGGLMGGLGGVGGGGWDGGGGDFNGGGATGDW